MEIRFYKLQVCGIDWLLLDRMSSGPGPVPDFRALARSLCRRRRGAGGMGIVALSRPETDIWAESFDAAGNGILLPPCAALCAARYLFDSGRGGRDSLDLRTRDGTVRVDIIDSTRFALNLGPALSPAGIPLREGEADRAAAELDVAGKALSILPVRLAGQSFAVVLSEGSLRDALSPFGRGESPVPSVDSRSQRFTPLAVRIDSRTSLAAAGRAFDACAAAGAALAAAGAYGLADREAAVRLGGDAVFVNGDADDGLYAAAKPTYIFSGEYWMEDPVDCDP
ncbi:MAG: hypothetical protein GX430_10975 [Treponema sp.]|nr:hypothetical protein [Treponema sp.]